MNNWYGVAKLSKEQVKVFSGTLYNFISSTLVFAITAIATIIVANSIGAQLYGSLSVGKILQDLLLVFCAVGMDAALVRFIPDFLAKEKFGSITSAISTASIIVGSFAVAFTVAFFLLSQFISIYIFHNYWLTPIIQLLILIFPLVIINYMIGAVLNGFQRFGLAMVVKVTFVSVYLFFLIIFLGYGFSLDGVIYAYIIGYSLSNVVGFVFVLREKRRVVKSGGEAKLFDFSLSREMFNFGRWSWGSAFIAMGFTRFNEILIGVFLIEATLGIYRISQTFASIIGYVGLALATTLNPYLSELTALKREEKVADMTKKLTNYCLVLSLLFSAPVIVFAYQLLGTVLSQEYIVGSDPLKILIIGFVIYNVSGPVSSYFFAKKRLVVNFLILSSSLLVGFVASALLITVFSINGLNQIGGMNGAAIGFTLGMVVEITLFALFTKRYFKLNILDKNSTIFGTVFVTGLLVLVFITNINFGLSILGLVIFEIALAAKYRKELRNVAKTLETYLLPSQKQVTSRELG